MSEAEFTTTLVQLFSLNRWMVYHALPAMHREGRWVTATQGHTGFPDLICARGGLVIAAELKVGKNQLSRAQENWRYAFGDGCVPFFVWRPKDMQQIVKIAKEGKW